MSMQGPQPVPILKEKYTVEEMKEYTDVLKRFKSKDEKTHLTAKLELAKMPKDKRERIQQYQKDLAVVIANNKRLDARRAELDEERKDLDRRKAEHEEHGRQLAAQRERIAGYDDKIAALNGTVAALEAENVQYAAQRDAALARGANALVHKMQSLTVGNGTNGNGTNSMASNGRPSIRP